jgi:hypothetical protein
MFKGQEWQEKLYFEALIVHNICDPLNITQKGFMFQCNCNAIQFLKIVLGILAIC